MQTPERILEVVWFAVLELVLLALRLQRGSQATFCAGNMISYIIWNLSWPVVLSKARQGFCAALRIGCGFRAVSLDSLALCYISRSLLHSGIQEPYKTEAATLEA